MGWLLGLPLGIFRVLAGFLMLILRFALPILVGLLVFKLFRALRGGGAPPRKEPQFHGPVYTADYREAEDEPILSTEPDAPVPFGYKTGWLAVRCQDPQRVLTALDALDIRLANWSTGLSAVGGPDERVFVSPVLSGWVLAVGLLELGDSRVLLERLAEEFEEVQFFATHRVTEYYTWIKYENGVLVRDYCYCGDQGAVLRDVGELTAAERVMGFDRFPHPGEEDTCEHFPCEEDVLDIAAAWGLDPRFGKTYLSSVGWLCIVP